MLTAKVFEYLAAGRPILAVVPPDGQAAELVRETGAGVVVAPGDVEGIAAALRDLEARWRAGTLDERVRCRPSCASASPAARASSGSPRSCARNRLASC